MKRVRKSTSFVYFFGVEAFLYATNPAKANEYPEIDQRKATEEEALVLPNTCIGVIALPKNKQLEVMSSISCLISLDIFPFRLFCFGK